MKEEPKKIAYRKVYFAKRFNKTGRAKNMLKNVKLEEVRLSNNEIDDDLNTFSNLIDLRKLHCSNNKLASLNLSNCFQLTELDCSGNLLTSLTLPTNLSNLK